MYYFMLAGLCIGILFFLDYHPHADSNGAQPLSANSIRTQELGLKVADVS